MTEKADGRTAADRARANLRSPIYWLRMFSLCFVVIGINDLIWLDNSDDAGSVDIALGVAAGLLAVFLWWRKRARS